MRLIAAGCSIFLMSVMFVSQVPTGVAVASERGQHIFRFDTFGDEQLWTDVLRMHEVLPAVTPAAALSLGLKVDSEALTPPVLTALASNQLNLKDPAVTLQLLKQDAVVGVVAKV